MRPIAEATHAVRSDLAKETVEALFGPPGEVGATLRDDGFASLLERVLAIEVVWGARAPATVGGRPQLVAISLDARAALLDGLTAGADKLSDESPSDASSALRANAFLWGRMDAITTTVDLLVDADRAQALAGTAKPPWHLLAQALQKPDRAWLPDERIPDDWALEDLLEQDLMRGPESSHERCARAAQLEVIADEVLALIVAAPRSRLRPWSSFDPTRP